MQDKIREVGMVRCAVKMAATDKAAGGLRRMRSACYGGEVIAGLRRLQQDDELTDFTVLAEGKSIKVHKVLLVAMSDYFRAMLLSPMKESKEHEVALQGLTAAALQQIVDFLYSGEIDLDLDNNLIDILYAASHLMIQTALDLCSDYMISLITFANADFILEIAKKFSLKKVTDFYTQKVLLNFEEFSATEQFLALSATDLARYLASGSLRVRSEAALFDAVARWYAHDQPQRAPAVSQLLPHIRFGLVSVHQLEQLRQHWLTRQLATAAVPHIARGVEYHRAAPHGYPLTPFTAVTPGSAGDAAESSSQQADVRATAPSLVLVHKGNMVQNRPFEVAAYNEAEGRFYHLAADISGSRDFRVVSLDNFLYICRVVDCGGGTLMNSLLRFDPRHMSVCELTPCRRLRLDPALVARGQWLYVFGGRGDGRAAATDAVECYDSHSNTWIDVLPMPSPTHQHAAAVIGEQVYLSGGVAGAERGAASSTLYRYTTPTQSWATLAPMHCPRRLHEMVAIGAAGDSDGDTGRLLVLGGIGAGGGGGQQSQIPIECYSPPADQWTLLTPTFAGCSVGHFLVHRDAVLSIGREHHDATEDEIWEYEVAADTWRPYTKMPKRTGLNTASAALLHVNFHDEKVYRQAIADKR